MLYERAPQLAYHYREFAVTLRMSTRPGAYTVVVRGEDGREIEGTFNNPLSPTELSLAVASIRASGNVLQRSVPEESLDPVRDMGARLYDALFHGSVGRAFLRALDAPEAGVRLRLVVEDASVAALPWEYLYDRRRDDFLVLSTRSPLVRETARPGLARPTGAFPEPVEPPARVLVAVADVTGTWDVGAEVAAVRSIAERSRNAVVDVLDGATVAGFVAALASYRPHVVHLIATGAEGGARSRYDSSYQRLAFLGPGEAGPAATQPDLLDQERLTHLFSGADELRAVVLNGCRTDELARALAEVVPATVGHRGDITDEAAVTFAAGFHSALLNGLPFEAAMTGGRLEIDSRDPGGREWSAAVAYLQTSDGTFLRAAAAAAPEAVTTARVRDALAATPADAPRRAGSKEQQSLRSLLTIHRSNLEALNAQRAQLESPPDFLLEQIATTSAEIQRLEGIVSGTGGRGTR